MLGIDIGLTAADAYSTISTLADPSATCLQKAVSVGAFAVGAVTIGGGYSTGLKWWGKKQAAKNAEVAFGPVPAKANNVLNHVDAKGAAPHGLKGGRPFANDGRDGGQVLPWSAADGSPVSYREWDVDPKGFDGRTSERIVTGSDGSAFYTLDHYRSFIKFR